MTGYCGTCRVHFTTLTEWAEHQHQRVPQVSPRREDVMAERDARLGGLLLSWPGTEPGLTVEEAANALEMSMTGARHALMRLRDSGLARPYGVSPERWVAA